MVKKMGRTKKESIYKNWHEVDCAIRKLGNLEIEKSRIEGLQTLEMNNIKEKYTAESEEIISEQKRISAEITRFCEQNKDSFLNKRSKTLNYGTVAYRVSSSVKLENNADVVIKSIEAANLDFCLKIDKKIDKDKLRELDAATLSKIGTQIVTKDSLTITPDVARIAAGVGEA